MIEQFLNSSPIMIAGPCAIESEEQMDQVGEFLQAQNIKFMRGSAYKPRTSPNSFQGLGPEGLKILKTTADKYDLTTVTEVMDTQDVELVAAHTDILQIGSRNMQNFSLLKAIGRSQKPVLLKRGLMATIKEWLSAAEYIANEGNHEIILCERGIRTFENYTRNTLDLAAVPIIRNESPYPIIVDPSHATGRKELILPMSKAALAAGAHGLFIEIHPNPPEALSDKDQQLNFDEFKKLLKALP